MKLSFDINESGLGTVAIDGQQVEDNVSGVDIKARVGKLTQVTVYFGFVEVEGEVETSDVKKESHA